MADIQGPSRERTRAPKLPTFARAMSWKELTLGIPPFFSQAGMSVLIIAASFALPLRSARRSAFRQRRGAHEQLAPRAPRTPGDTQPSEFSSPPVGDMAQVRRTGLAATVGHRGGGAGLGVVPGVGAADARARAARKVLDSNESRLRAWIAI